MVCLHIFPRLISTLLFFRLTIRALFVSLLKQSFRRQFRGILLSDDDDDYDDYDDDDDDDD